MPTRVLIALGSNLGDRRSILDRAISDLSSLPGLDHVATSPYRETAPVGGPSNQGPFLNAAATFDTTLAPHELHARLRVIEATAGRVREVRWGERNLDLDLILFGSAYVRTLDLTIPHPRFAIRRFVLAPAAEIAPTLVDPRTGSTIAGLLANVDRRPTRVVLSTGFDVDGPLPAHRGFRELVQTVAHHGFLGFRARQVTSAVPGWNDPWFVDVLSSDQLFDPTMPREVGHWHPRSDGPSPPTFVAVCGPGADRLAIDRPVITTWFPDRERHFLAIDRPAPTPTSPTSEGRLVEAELIGGPGSDLRRQAVRQWVEAHVSEVLSACEATRTG